MEFFHRKTPVGCLSLRCPIEDAIRDFVRPNPTALDLIELTTFSARDHRTCQRAYRERFSGSEATQG